jgi:hypothetical protein
LMQGSLEIRRIVASEFLIGHFGSV